MFFFPVYFRFNCCRSTPHEEGTESLKRKCPCRNQEVRCRSTPHEEGTERNIGSFLENFELAVAGALPTKRELKGRRGRRRSRMREELQEHSPRRGN